ncbi:MAG: hypothetical protein HFJ48_02700, partial [Clostridia bacterium]|nr:hypothetical protein [Clostridia bacterium]
MKTNKKKENKVKELNKKKIVIIGVIILLAIMISVVIILNTRKEEIQKYGGIVFNKEINLNNVNLIESSDETPVQVPVPKGYVASSVESERTVNGGFVIYEGEEEVTEENLEEAKKTRNQFVWIPIEDSTDMYYISGNNMYGAYYEFSATGYTRKTRTYEP